MQRSQKETRKGQQEMQKGLEDMQGNQEETKQEMQKGQERMQKFEEKIAVVEEKIEKKVRKEIKRIKVQVEERNEEVAGNFNLVSQRVEYVEKKLLELSTYDRKTNWEVYKTQFSIISDADGGTEGVKACQLAASLRGAAAEVLQTLPDTERLNLNFLYNALDLRFGQKYSKDYTRLQMKTRLHDTGESLQEYASEIERLANLDFSDYPENMQEIIALQYFVDVLKDGEIQRAIRRTDIQDLKSVLLYALKLEASLKPVAEITI
ncbi:uncharacterized protein TNCV_2247251 [Trichonephila clavipes]|nr:uncharacterized protein TNCV_2247251 [Trichonephila clavipes]